MRLENKKKNRSNKRTGSMCVRKISKNWMADKILLLSFNTTFFLNFYIRRFFLGLVYTLTTVNRHSNVTEKPAHGKIVLKKGKCYLLPQEMLLLCLCVCVFFLFSLTFLSRLFHSYRDEPIGRWGETGVPRENHLTHPQADRKCNCSDKNTILLPYTNTISLAHFYI